MYNVKLRACALQIVGDADLPPLRSPAIAFTHHRLLLLPISPFCSLLDLFVRLISYKSSVHNYAKLTDAEYYNLSKSFQLFL